MTQKPSALRACIPYLWPARNPAARARVVASMLLLIVSKLAGLYMPLLYKYTIDALSAQKGVLVAGMALPLLWIVAYTVARLLNNVLQQLRDAVFAVVGQRALRQLARTTFEHVHQLSLRFHVQRKTGALSRVIDRGTKGLDFLLRMLLFNLVPTAFEILCALVMLQFTLGTFYMALTAATIAVYVAGTYFLNEWRTAFRRQMNERDNDAAQKAGDSLINYETVKYFANEATESQRFDHAMAGYEKAAVKLQISLAWLNFFQGLIIALGLGVMMLVLGRQVLNGQQTLGDFVLLNALLLQLYMPLNFLGTVFREIKQSLIDMESMFDLLHLPPEVVDAPNAQPLANVSGEVVFDNVHFGYDPDRMVLRGVSFSIPAGKTVAVVGASGGGKSTLSRLLFRFYDVTQGRILIDGHDIRALTQDSLRRAIGIVPQDTVLFNDTLGYNIRYGCPSASEALVHGVAQSAQIADFIDQLPQGYNTAVGERGLKLSGGEKQRVAIARTLLKNPPILVLDEATSALDTATEQDIQDALRQVMANRSVLLIAHRLSTVVHADEIVVLNDGVVAERGTHAALLALGGRYAALWNAQLHADNEE